ncbi:MAG: hypothetical protein M3300_02120 [Actinomycetota bacterium]|nr:hypothetical protein [Actinomycetota bacterium]
MIQNPAELGDLRQGGIPIGRDERDATIQRFEVVQHLSAVESESRYVEGFVQGNQVVAIPGSAHSHRLFFRIDHLRRPLR